MKILDISIDGFGTFSGLELHDLSQSVSVLYGRNEAGKTTLLQFLRTMLYGLTPDRQQRYLPPRGGGAAGGWLRVKTPTGTYRVHRQLDAQPITTEIADGQLRILPNDPGQEEKDQPGGQAWRVMLSGVDENTYRNVYAVGLREMQELATLSDSDAASYLYDLSAGLDRVSLVEVLRQLKQSRERLLNGSDPDAEIFRLLQRRDELQQQLHRVGQSLGRYHDLLAARTELAAEITRLEDKRREVAHRVRLAELASGLLPPWQQLQAVRRRLRELGDVPQVLPADLERVEGFSEQIRGHQETLKQLKTERRQRRQQAASYPILPALPQLAPRVAALAEQTDWMRSLETQIDQLEAEVQRREAELAEQQQALGIDPPPTVKTPAERADLMATLKGPARAVRQARQRLQQHRQSAAAERQAGQDDIDRAADQLAGHAAEDLTSSLEKASDRVELLRQRLAVDARLEKLGAQRADLEEDREELLDCQVLPSWGLAASGLAFALGMMLLLAGIFTALYGTGWPYILMGLTLVVGVVLIKVMFEQGAKKDLERCGQALEKLDATLEETRQTRDQLDTQIPPGGGPLASQLRRAEEQLAGLQALVPLQEQQAEAQRWEETQSQKAAALQADYQEARKTWCRTLHQAGLPANLSPRQAQQAVREAQRLGRLRQVLEDRRDEVARRRGELSGCAQRVGALYEEWGIAPVHPRLVDQVQQLVQATAEQQQWIALREGCWKESHQLRRQQLALSRELWKLHQQRRELLERAGAESPAEFRELAEAYAQQVELRDQQKQLQARIRTAISGICQPPELAQLLKGATARRLERRWEQAAARLEELEQGLQEAFEKRGRLSEQLKALAEDRRGAQQQLKLNSVEQRLQNAIDRWRQYAVTSCLLQSIRRRYEQERQPATLQEASQYFQQLTDGRYGRIWTPLDEDALRVDDREGHSLRPEDLSRGTREQLFLALRLALVSLYAQRGVQLPLVLDDVLVNFDSQRAQAAARVLCDFAARGHQLLVFTCHEHLWEMFASLGSDARRLPGEPSPPRAAQPPPTRRRRKKVAAPPAAEPIAPPAAEEPSPPSAAGEAVGETAAAAAESAGSLPEPSPRAAADPQDGWEVDDAEQAYLAGANPPQEGVPQDGKPPAGEAEGSIPEAA